MPRIFDNIQNHLSDALSNTLQQSERVDFCVGYFNLRGWKVLEQEIAALAGEPGPQCRLLVGMYRSPDESFRRMMAFGHNPVSRMDNLQLLNLKRQMLKAFRDQLTVGVPSNADQASLQTLVDQIRNGRLQIKLFAEYPLHAKLYLLYRQDFNNPITAYLGSSNLTLPGLAQQGELNIDVLDQDACQKLAAWFRDRWENQWCLDISQDLIQVINESWAREVPLRPYDIYLKMAYHLSAEARIGLSEFKVPRDLQTTLFDYQTAAVQIAAHHLNKRGGVVLGDVVGLGKTLMATTLARIFQDDFGLETLIICPKNLVPMWRKYQADYRLIGQVLSLSQVTAEELENLRRYRLLIIDESHNLRNDEGKRYRAIATYIQHNESKCILLSATPYNKNFLDLSAQLRLFIPEDSDLGIRPERYLDEIGGEAAFNHQHQVPVRSIQAFQHSTHLDDWRDLMRLYMVRRTRSFILKNYTEVDTETGRQFLRRGDKLSYFPRRQAKTLTFSSNEQYQRLYSDEVVNLINALHLPRYGLGQYIRPFTPASPEESKQLENLSRAGQRLMGFSRTNLFKRLESSGAAFLQSVDRHILRNEVFLYAIEQGLPLPIGTLEADTLDPRTEDEDTNSLQTALDIEGAPSSDFRDLEAEEAYRQNYADRAQEVYALFRQKYQKRFRWIRSQLFSPELAEQLAEDSRALQQVLSLAGEWQPDQDTKLEALHHLLLRQHPQQKILIFSQFADTVRYLEKHLRARGLRDLAGVTGDSDDPTALAWRFSPRSNDYHLREGEAEIRVLISTDVLSEGQNLQDCAIIVNFDLPWAIIRLVQRAGRVDRIGQAAENIYCYSFLPDEGIERIIRLRARVRERLHQNSEVLGSDEQFFEDEDLRQNLQDLYTEKSGLLEGDLDEEVDLASYAYQIWLNAIKHNKEVAKRIPALADVVFSTRHYQPSLQRPEGVLVYMQTEEGGDSLAWLNAHGQVVTQSPLAILRAAECEPDTPATEQHPDHHGLVAAALELMAQEEQALGGQLGRPNSIRRRIYERMKDYIHNYPLLIPAGLREAHQALYDYPLRESAKEALARQMKAGISDEGLALMLIDRYQDERLCIKPLEGDEEGRAPKILCSLGLFR